METIYISLVLYYIVVFTIILSINIKTKKEFFKLLIPFGLLIFSIFNWYKNLK